MGLLAMLKIIAFIAFLTLLSPVATNQADQNGYMTQEPSNNTGCNNVSRPAWEGLRKSLDKLHFEHKQSHRPAFYKFIGLTEVLAVTNFVDYLYHTGVDIITGEWHKKRTACCSACNTCNCCKKDGKSDEKSDEKSDQAEPETRASNNYATNEYEQEILDLIERCLNHLDKGKADASYIPDRESCCMLDKHYMLDFC